MKKLPLLFIICSSLLYGANLEDIYNTTIAGEGYDKLIVLYADSVYYGGLIQDVESLCIHGNGAIIDLQNETIEINGKDKKFDIDHCVIKSSTDTSIIFKNISSGHIINNTFYGKSVDNEKAACAVYFEECLNDTSVIQNNIFYGFNKSIYFYTSDADSYFEGIPLEIEYNIHYDCNTPYLCWAGWTGFPSGFIPTPGNGEQLNDPALIDPASNNFQLALESVCIDNGCETIFQYNGNAPDIGAIESSISVFRGTNLSGSIDNDLIVSESPYIVCNDISIDSLSSIKINPGVEIKINYLKSIQIYGRLNCSGTINDSIRISSNSIYHDSWGQIHFNPSASVSNIFDYTTITGGSIVCSNDSISLQNCNMLSTVYCNNTCLANISNNTFNNSSDFTGKRVIHCSENAKLHIENNLFYASCIYSDSCHLQMIRNKFLGQTYNMAQQYWLINLKNQSSAYLEANLFQNNYGAILLENSSCRSYNNLISNCSTSYLFRNNSSGCVVNNTISSDGYGIRCSNNSTSEVVNSILYNYGEWSYSLQEFDSSEVSARYCLLTTAFEGENLIFEDPCFADNFNIGRDSPCIDAGTPDTTGLDLPPSDYMNNNRIINGRVDIGCYETSFFDAIEPNSTTVLKDYLLYPNYPNPFNPCTTIEFNLPINSPVLLTIYNSAGQIVDVLIDQKIDAGKHSILWDASSLPSGIYYCQLTANKYKTTTKCLLLK